MKNLMFIMVFVMFTSINFAQKTSYQLSSHILDISKGVPAIGITIQLEKYNDQNKAWNMID